MNTTTTTTASSSFPDGVHMTFTDLVPGARVAVELDTGSRASGTVFQVAGDASWFVLNTRSGAAVVAAPNTRTIISLGAAQDLPVPTVVPTTDREIAEAEINLGITSENTQAVDNN